MHQQETCSGLARCGAGADKARIVGMLRARRSAGSLIVVEHRDDNRIPKRSAIAQKALPKGGLFFS